VPDQTYAGRQGVLTLGGRMRLNDQLGVFAESRAASGEGPRSLTNGFGVDFAPAKHWTTGLRFDTGKLSDRVSGDLKRDAVSVNVGYRDDKLKVLSAIEYRNDRSTSLGSVTGVCTTDTTPSATPCVSTGGSTQRETVLLKNSVTYQVDPSLRLLGVANLSRSSSSQGAFYDGDYTEAVLGAAYRPIDNDRWNALLKYTYFANLPSSGQIGPFTNSVLDYSQRSHVLNLDAIYDLTPWLSIGGKYGLRVGELRASRTSGEWFSSRAQLFVARADMHFVKEWDAVLEWRLLDVKAANDSRMGALIGVYRHVGEHGKIGVGYNFTDFSDDLTDQSYRSRGFFINAIATF
jgi:opacity protein-like surface antigen